MKSRFGDTAKFIECAFLDYANFRGSEFKIDADCNLIQFDGNTLFENVSFNGPASFMKSRFGDTAKFIECAFLDYANFNGSEFKIDVDFDDALFGELADFVGSKFLGYADFSGSQFNGDANFSDVLFNGPADFSRSKFRETLNLHGAQFKRNAHFESCKIGNLNLTETRYDWIFLHWDSIDRFEFDEAAYHSLITNYDDLGWRQDATGCYYSYGRSIQEQEGENVSWFRSRLNDLWSIFRFSTSPRPMLDMRSISSPRRCLSKAGRA
jgi:hypothetical protein